MPLGPSRLTAVVTVALLSLHASALRAETIPNRYVVVLSDEPAASKIASRDDLARPEIVAARRAIEDKQAALASTLEARGIHVTGSVSVLQNALFVAAPASRVPEIQAMSGVVAVRPMRRFKPLLSRAAQQVNAPAAWTAVGGMANAGLGIKIGVLDSGIDQKHPAFQDSTLPMPKGFPLCTTGHPEDCAYTSNKVIVARSYVRYLSAPSDPKAPAADDLPDDYSPRDRDGHGTSVASAAAAVPTATPAVTTTGTPLTIQGIAPKAYLGNYKIAGSPGVAEGASDQTLMLAVQDAFTDGMDVITCSWGSNALSDWASDPVAAAFEKAAQGGAVVVVAAGNNAAFNSISSPANAPSVIAVGATENSHVLLPSVSVNSSKAAANLKNIAAQPSDSTPYPTSEGAAVGPLVDVTQLGNDGLACSALPAYSLLGAFALVKRGTCTFATKATNAQTAGAIGLIVYMADSSPTISMEGLDPQDAAFMGPAVMVSNADGLNLKSFADANPGAQVTIDTGGMEVELSTWSQNIGFSPTVAANMLAGFSSTGPTPEGLMKPDLVATGGSDVYLSPDPNDTYLPAASGLYLATQSYDPNQSYAGGTNYSANGYWAANGTSFAAPIVAGAAALVKQAKAGQNLRGTQIKSLLVNTASATAVGTDDFGDPVDAQWIGAGLVNAGAAVAATLTVEPSTISFGILGSGSLPKSQTLTVTNISTSSANLTASVSCCTVNAAAGTVSGISVGLSQSSFTLAAGASVKLTATLSGTIPKGSEYSGSVAIQQGGNTVATIPFMYLVGDGVAAGSTVVSGGGEGPAGTDAGPVIVQVLDQYGVPIANSPVTFAVSPANGATVQSVQGEPACTPSGTGYSCNTDKFGFAWAEVILGTAAGNTQVTASAGGTSTPETYTTQAPPNVTGVADAAAGLTTVAPGSYVAIYGSGLSNYSDSNGAYLSLNTPVTTVASDPLTPNGYALPLQIDFVTVSFDVPSAGISVAGRPTYVSPGQVNVQIPWELQGQSSALMKVSLDGDLLGNVVSLKLANAAPAFFTYLGNVAATDLTGKVITTANGATRGQVVTLYANGLGPVANQPATGDPAGVPLSTTTTTPVVMIGGQQAQVQFSGLVPGLPGLYQLNVTVPSGLSAGPQSTTVAIGGATSPAIPLPVQ